METMGKPSSDELVQCYDNLHDRLLRYGGVKDQATSPLLPMDTLDQGGELFATTTKLTHEFTGETGYMVAMYKTENLGPDNREPAGSFYKPTLDGMPALVSLAGLQLTKRMSIDRMRTIYDMLDSAITEYETNYDPNLLCHR